MEKLALYGGKPIRKSRLPFYVLSIGQEEINAVVAALGSGHISGNGPIGNLLEKELEEFANCKHALFTSSCSAAIELALMSCDIMPGDEVICPSFTFVSTANAVIQQGAKPVFVEINEDTLNIDPDLIEKAITKKTKAIITVHYAGHACEMKKINELASCYKLKIVEDAAQAIGSYYNGRHLGTIGDVGCISFHGSKNLVCGEGGALLTNNNRIAKKAEIIREKGTNRSAFLRGEVDKYTWISKGSSYVQSDILAAIVREQLKKVNVINRMRAKNAQYLTDQLASLGKVIKLPKVIEGAQTNWHIYAIRVEPKFRDWMIDALMAEGIQATFHFIPLHSSPYARKHLGYKSGDLPITEKVSKSIIRLPLYPQLKQEDLNDIAIAVKKVIEAKYGKK